ncbi:O-antigen ligase family protein [Pseudoalteromonas sp. T1lg48]|uniref:O-antigen ligase family protein n=1 Tax=Pseudoalteromonas sp. T1lg48 TaxID=2077100 RepID=UPI000CF5EDC1|nr:O-antigen ligase family protein [Pseudoalteromonas sp. T1lg48]
MSSLTVYDTYRVIEVFFLITALTLLNLPNHKQLNRAFSVFVFLGLLTLFISPEKYVLHSAFAIALTLGLYLFALQSSDSKLPALVVGVSTLVYTQLIVVVVIIVGLTSLLLNSTFVIDPFSHFNNIRYLNHMQVATLPILLASLTFCSSSYRKYLYLLIALNFIVAIFSGARGALLAFFLTIALFSLIDKKNSLKVVGLLIVIALLNLLASADSGEYLTRTTSSGRIHLWLSTIQELKLENLVIGITPGIFDSSIANLKLNHPHNSILQLTYSYGFIAAMCVVGAYLYPIWKHRHLVKKSLKINLLSSILLSSGLLSLFSGVFVNPLSQLYLAAIWGLLMSQTLPPQDNKLKIEFRVIKTLFAFVLAITCWLSFDMMQKHAMGIIRPGLWLDLTIK